MDGFRVDPQQLRTAARGIGDATSPVDQARFEDLPGKSDAYGHEKVYAAVNSFCTTWELAKQLLQQRCADAGGALDSSAGVYEAQEARGTATFGPAVPQPIPQPMPLPGPQLVPQPSPQPMPLPQAQPIAWPEG